MKNTPDAAFTYINSTMMSRIVLSELIKGKLTPPRSPIDIHKEKANARCSVGNSSKVVTVRILKRI